MSAPLATLISGAMAYRDWKDRKRTDAALSERDLISDIWVALRRDGDVQMDETAARRELSDAMLAAGIAVYHRWKNADLSERDLALDIWVALKDHPRLREPTT